MGFKRSASLLVSCTSLVKLAGAIAKAGRLLDFSQQLQRFTTTEDRQAFFPGGHLHSAGVTSGVSTNVSTGVEGQWA